MRYTLIGGHSAGRVVDLDHPAPVFLQVPYRIPADPFEAAALAYGPNPDPDAILLGIERYDRMIISPADYPGPPVYGYVCPDLPK
jgi:hypothetical protein